jgi:hypothetical protein
LYKGLLSVGKQPFAVFGDDVQQWNMHLAANVTIIPFLNQEADDAEGIAHEQYSLDWPPTKINT